MIWIDAEPTVGYEEAGRHSGLVLSPSSYNGKTSLVIACAMTSKKKGYPFAVEMSDGGIILVDQSGAWIGDSAMHNPKDTAPLEILKQVCALLGTLLQI